MLQNDQAPILVGECIITQVKDDKHIEYNLKAVQNVHYIQCSQDGTQATSKLPKSSSMDD